MVFQNGSMLKSVVLPWWDRTHNMQDGLGGLLNTAVAITTLTGLPSWLGDFAPQQLASLLDLATVAILGLSYQLVVINQEDVGPCRGFVLSIHTFLAHTSTKSINFDIHSKDGQVMRLRRDGQVMRNLRREAERFRYGSIVLVFFFSYLPRWRLAIGTILRVWRRRYAIIGQFHHRL